MYYHYLFNAFGEQYFSDLTFTLRCLRRVSISNTKHSVQAGARFVRFIWPIRYLADICCRVLFHLEANEKDHHQKIVIYYGNIFIRRC